uniref:Uncharacterized protein n=1 Tax=Musca domestica TaxID=7370 RepID=A0A1I8NJE6_MUSDO
MDIKTLLLKGLSSQKPIRACHRLLIENKGYTINFQLSGKYLKITRIKRITQKRKTLKQRIRWRQKFHQRYRNKVKSYLTRKLNEDLLKELTDANKIRTIVLQRSKIEKINIVETVKICRGTETNMPNTKASIGIQTATRKQQVKMVSNSTETERTICRTSGQQTLMYNKRKSSSGPKPFPPLRYFSSTGTQTELQTTTCGVQCKYRTVSVAIQSDQLATAAAGIQVYSNNHEFNKSPDVPIQNCSGKLPEQEIMIYMLNEIGELVINQNALLINNSKLLNQISERATLHRKRCIIRTNGILKRNKTTPKCLIRKRSKYVIDKEREQLDLR